MLPIITQGSLSRRLFVNVAAAWCAIYAISAVWSSSQRRSSWLAGTVDHVDTLWVKLVFLNLPLQALLALTAYACWHSAHPTVTRIGRVLAVLATGLIVGHVVVSFWVGRQ